jgi:ribulose 1,5-bisphosphate synthetase/thiazole synthase
VYLCDMQQIGPRFRNATLAKRDGRTRPARMLKSLRADLIAHIGGQPSIVQAALIDRACQISLHIAFMDRRFAEGGIPSGDEIQTYTTLSDSLVRVLHDLGVASSPASRSSMTARSASRA